MKRGYVDTPEGQIHYLTEGSGEPVLMLHRAGSSSDLFADIIPIMGKSHRVIAMDMLGYGSSDFPAHKCTIEDYARNALHVLDAFGIMRASVVGSMTGAAVALEIATAHPARVDKLVLQVIDFLEPEERKQRQEFYHNKGMRIRADGSHLMEAWQERMSRPHMTPEMAHRSLVNYLDAGQCLNAEDGHRALFAYEIGEKLPLIKGPTLLLWGIGDAHLDRLEPSRKLIPRCQTQIIAGAFVYPHWEKPQEYAAAILEFLRDPAV